VLRFIASQLRATRTRALVLGLGLLIAGVGFSLLSSVSVSSAIAVRGTLNRNFQPAYDILVRPRGAVSRLERSEGLVDDGFLSDLYGGITMAEWRRILWLPGVAVAAPVENVGTAIEAATVTVNLDSVVGAGSQQLFRVVPSFVVHGGLASYPSVDEYFFYSRGRWTQQPSAGGIPTLAVPGERPLRPCHPYVHGVPSDNLGPFAHRANEALECGGPNQHLRGVRFVLDHPGHDTVTLGLEIPVMVAAIDPVQEAKLVGLDRAMVHGRYLSERQGLSTPIFFTHVSKLPGVSRQGYRTIPLIASSRVFADEVLDVRVLRLDAPDGPRLPQRLSEAGSGGYLDALAGRPVMERRYSPRALYRQVLADPSTFSGYWTVGGVRYRVRGPKTLAARTTRNPASVWEPIGATPFYQFAFAPAGANATQFRRLTAYQASGAAPTLPDGDIIEVKPGLRVQGTFNPDRLRGFAPLSRVPLGTFFPPTVTGATPRSAVLLHHRALGPTTNLGGYLSQPPLFLTTLKAATPFFDSSVFTGDHPRRAPIAAVQVRVSGVHGATRASISRVRRVAGEIYGATHLQVDITAGSSPTPVRIDLPAGGFGQPALPVVQGWVKKGVTTVVLGASNAKNTALFTLILLVAGLFIANASFAAVRQRRAQIATLATFGWDRREVFGAVLGEVGVIGLIAGVTGAIVSAIVIAVAGLHFSLLRVLGVVPASLLIALVAGAVPAWIAARLSPLAGLSPPVRAGAARRRVRSVLGLAWVNLTRLPWRTVLGGFGLVLGVGALAFLLAIQHAFSGTVAGDVLGNHINVEVQGSDYVAVALILVLAVASVADVLIMNLRERSGEIATLQAFGWSDATLRRLVVSEGVTVGVIGSLLGAGIGLAGAWALGVDPTTVIPGTVAAFFAGVVVCATAVLPAVYVLTRQMPAATLAPE
jgi:putative ABC transport system permease protein